MLVPPGMTPSVGNSADPIGLANSPVFIGMAQAAGRSADASGVANSAISIAATSRKGSFSSE